MTVTLIQCTDSKRDEACSAGLLYDTSAYYRKMRRVAKLRGEEWYILSAKHGLLDPETEIEPYDAFGISVEQAESVIQTLQERGHTEATVIAGNKYLAPLRSVCEETGFSLRTIAEGQRIGKRMVKLDELANELQNHGLENYA